MFSAAHQAATSAVEKAFASARNGGKASYSRPADACKISVEGGVEGVDYYYENVAYTRTSAHPTKGNTHTDNLRKLVINSEEPLTLSTSGEVDGTIWINPGIKANLIFRNIQLKSNIPVHIERNKDASGETAEPETSLHITLADKSHNTLHANKGGYSAGIHCGKGTSLTIDDSVKNIDVSGNPIVPKNGMIPIGTTFIDKTGAQRTATASKHNALDLLESNFAGTLEVISGYKGAGIGSVSYEDAGKLTFNGGIITAKGFNNPSISVTDTTSENWFHGVGAGIGSGEGSSPTFITINGGEIDATGAYHGAAIGGSLAAWYDNSHNPAWFGRESSFLFNDSIYSGKAENSGNLMSDSTMGNAGHIRINGGLVRATAPYHGNAIGKGCASWNKGGSIVITGGTVLPDSTNSAGYMDIGGNSGYVVITGGSIRTDESGSKFENMSGNGYAFGSFSDDGAGGLEVDQSESNKVFMVTIDLGSEIEKRNKEAGITGSNLDEAINEWSLSVGGKEYPYGAPSRFNNGKLFLWLPKSATEKEITVTLKYVDKNGHEQTVEPLFRQPGGALGGTVLKRYIYFTLPDDFKDLTKYYDGSPLRGLTIDEHNQIPTDDGKVLSQSGKVQYKYQLYSADQQTPLGAESSASTSMPCDVGYMKLTVDSTEWCDDPDFSTNYWGHRAIGWCEIKPTNSAVDLVKATWNAGVPDEEKDGSEQDDAGKQLTINATIGHGTHHPDGTPIDGAKCQAPRGYVQLYVDGKAVGEPVKLVFVGDTDEDGNAIPTGDARVNAVATAVGEGSRTDFTYTFVPAEKDFLLPDATKDNRHIVSLQYLPPVKDGESPDPEPANYLESVNPADHPEQAPKAEVAVEPIDPNPTTDVERDPENPGTDTPPPTIDTERYDPDNPGDPDDPDGFVPYPEGPDPSMNAYTGTIETYWDVPTEGNEHPGRIIVKVKTPSSGKLTITSEDGELYEADFVRDKDGNPVRNDDGTYSLVLDPKKLGDGKLVFQQAPNGAYEGSVWSYHVIVKPNPKIAPKTSVAKEAENLTHPGAPVQPGDRVRYTITAKNAAAGSAWNGVTVTDRLPACLETEGMAVRLANPTEDVDGQLRAASAGAAPALGEYALSALDSEGRATITVPAGRVYGAGTAVVTVEATVRADAAGPGIASDLANIAEATGTRPDPEHPGKELSENPEPSDPATPPKSPTVAPADPDVKITKSVENATAPGAKVTRVGDVLRYTVTLSNEGAANSCLQNAVVSDPLPAGLEPVPRSIRMTLPDGTEVAVDDSAYDRESRTLAVTAGDLWGGEKAVLSFEATVGEAALGANLANIALAHGTVPSEGPGGAPSDPEPGKPAAPPSGEPEAFTPPATPPVMVGEDPAEGDVKVEKAAENLTSGDGKTRVGDEVRYTITLRNDGAGTAWMDAVVKDEVPRGLEPAAGTIRATLPGGGEVSVADDAYDAGTRTLAVAVGHLYGGQEARVEFTAVVTEDAVGADIGNVAAAVGDLPSKWDPDGDHPEPGKPFSPPGGWPDYEKDRPTVESPKAYPPGGEKVTAEKLARTEGEGSEKPKARPISGTKLAQTGDAALAAALPLMAAAAVASGALLLARRRLRR